MPSFVTRTNISPGTLNAWVDVDLSSLIPSGATGVILRVTNNSFVAANPVGWRKKGSTDNRTNRIYLQYQAPVFVGVDANRIVQLYRGGTGFTFYLEGYFGSEAVFFDNAIAKTPAGGFSWTTASIASDSGGDTALAALVEFAGSWAGLRKTGSTDNPQGSIDSHCGGIVAVDGSEQFDYVTEGSSNPVFVVGYLKSGATLGTNGTDRQSAVTAAYDDVAAFASGNTAGVYAWVNTGTPTATLRKKGDSADLYFVPAGNFSTWIVEGDASRVVQQKISATTADLVELGALAAAVVGPPPPPVLLSLPGVQDITASSARPKVTITYP